MTTAITKPKHKSAYDWIDSNADTKNLEKKWVGEIFIYGNPGINTSYISLHYCIKDVIFKEKVQDTQLSVVGEGEEKKMMSKTRFQYDTDVETIRQEI